MPFDELTRNQDEAEMLPRRFGYPVEDDEDGESKPSIGMRIVQMAPRQASLAEPRALAGIDVQRQAASNEDSQVEAKPSIGQQIVQIGKQGVPPFDIQDGRSVWRQDPQTLAKPNIGQRIMRGPLPATMQLMPLPNVRPTGRSFNVSPEQQRLFNSLIPAGRVPNASGLGSSQTPHYQASGTEGLGRSAGEAASAMTGGVLGADQMLGPSTPVVNTTNLVKALSVIKRPKVTPDVQPNLNINSPRQARRALGKTLAPLMQSIHDWPQPQAVRHLTQDDINEAAAVAYSENVDGTLRDYEAIISAILNRVRSGDRQFVDPGQQFTVHNVTHSKAHGDQFQGVPDSMNYRGFAANHRQAAENARIAAEHIAAHGPGHRWMFFIAPRNGKLPRDRERGGLGHNMAQVDHTDNVYLYAPGQTPHSAHRGHGHGRAMPPRSSPPQHER